MGSRTLQPQPTRSKAQRQRHTRVHPTWMAMGRMGVMRIGGPHITWHCLSLNIYAPLPICVPTTTKFLPFLFHLGGFSCPSSVPSLRLPFALTLPPFPPTIPSQSPVFLTSLSIRFHSSPEEQTSKNPFSLLLLPPSQTQKQMESKPAFQTDLNLEATELRLGLPGIATETDDSPENSSGLKTNNKRNLQNDSAPPPKCVMIRQNLCVISFVFVFSVLNLCFLMWVLQGSGCWVAAG